MIVVERSDKRSLVTLRGIKDDNIRNEEGATDSESAGESDTSFEEGPRNCHERSAFQDRWSILPDSHLRVSSLANNRIGVTKHDFELCNWKIIMDKSDNTGICLNLILTDRTEKVNHTLYPHNLDPRNKIFKKKKSERSISFLCNFLGAYIIRERKRNYEDIFKILHVYQFTDLYQIYYIHQYMLYKDNFPNRCIA